jgi:hypothetical protein
MAMLIGAMTQAAFKWLWQNELMSDTDVLITTPGD